MAHSEIQVDENNVRATKWTIEPGGVIPMHVHDYEYVVVPLVNDSMHIRNADGTSLIAELTIGNSYRRAAGAEHEVSNPGSTTIEFVEVELLTPAQV